MAGTEFRLLAETDLELLLLMPLPPNRQDDRHVSHVQLPKVCLCDCCSPSQCEVVCHDVDFIFPDD